MYIVTDDIKKQFASSETKKRGYIRVLPLNSFPEVIIDETMLKSFTITDDVYTPNQGIIGSVIAKEIKIDFFKDLEIPDQYNRIYEAYIGVENNSDTSYIPCGQFLLEKPTTDATSTNTQFKGKDYMIKLNKVYEDTTFPKKIREIINKISELTGVQISYGNLPNLDFVVDGNPFIKNETCRDVLRAVCQITCTYARVNRLGILELRKLEAKPKFMPEERILDIHKYFKKSAKIQDTYGPINRVVLRYSQVEGENLAREDAEDIKKNGVQEFTIADNPFAFSEDTRFKLIDAIWAELKGKEYCGYQLEYIPVPYLDAGDGILIKEQDGTEHFSIIGKNEITYKGILKQKTTLGVQNKNETKYAFTATVKNALKTVEFFVDKVNGIIKSLSKTVDKNTERISLIEQSDEEIKLQVQNSIGKTEILFALGDSRTVAPTEGWSKEAPQNDGSKFMWQKMIITTNDGKVEEAVTCISGADGKNGKDGQNGSQGPAGPAGQDGKNGTDGKNGSNGKSAYQVWLDAGNTGTEQDYLNSLKGKDGSQGPVGPQGEKGKDGAVGPQGPAGTNGAPGKNGTNGKDGYTPIKGKDYFDGKDGANGANGKDGAVGPRGPQGEPGKNGAIGPQGPKGDKGETGAKGDTGAAGKDGAKGEKGNSVIQLATDKRRLSLADWKIYGKLGHIEKWVRVTNTKDFKKGDTGVLSGYISDKNNSEVSLYGIVTEVGKDYVTMNSQTLLFGLDGAKGDTGPAGPIGPQGPTGQNGAPGKDGTNGKDGIGIKTVDVYYYLSTSSTSLAGGTWSTKAPTWVNGKYMWTKQKTTYSNDTFKESNPACITGQKGATGNNGAKGKGISSIKEQYYLSTSSTEQVGGSWSDEQQIWKENNFFWIRQEIHWDDNTNTVTAPILAMGINTALNEAENAKKDVIAQAEKYESKLTENKTNILAEVKKTTDKIEQDVESNTNTISSLQESVATKVSSKDLTVTVKNVLTENGVDKVKTSTGFVFDEKGLNVKKDGSTLSTQITENGMYVQNGNDVRLSANASGVDAENLHATTYLIIGKTSRFEDFEKDGHTMTGCFWIGEASPTRMKRGNE